MYRTLKFKDSEEGEKDDFFDWRTLTVVGSWYNDKAEEIQNYYVDCQSKFSSSKLEGRETALQHELVHFMDAIDDLNTLKVCEKIREELTDIIKSKNTVEELKMPNAKPKKNCSESEEEEEEEEEIEEEGDCDDSVQTEQVVKLLRTLYDNGGEMWAMYGILFIPDARSEDNENSDDSGSEDSIKGEFYYDPINEAVMNAEALQVVRTGHARFKNEDHIDPHDDETPSTIKVLEALNEKIGIYGFYFSEGERLRKLIGK